MLIAGFDESNSLPIALMQSLTVTVPGLRWGNSDTRDAMLGRALSYLVLFSTLGIVLRWSYGIKLLSTADEDGNKDDSQEEGYSARNPPNTIAPMRENREDEELYNADAPLLAISEVQQRTLAENGNVNGKLSNGGLQSSPRTPRFSEAPATLGRPMMPRPQGPTRRWTAIGNREETEHAEYFHKSIQTSENFKRNISKFRSFPNTPSHTPAASSYTSSASEGESESDEEGQDSDVDTMFGGTGRKNNTLPSRNATQAWLRKTRRKCTSGLVRWVWRPLIKFLKGMQAFMTAPL